MIAHAHSTASRRVVLSTSLAIITAVVLALPAGAFSSAWSKPKRIFPYNGTPLHATAIDASGKVHVATEKGSKGIHYITNKSGSWKTCRLSTGNDRYPSIAVAGDVVHFAFARKDDGERGLYTAATDQLAAAADGCGLALRKRYKGGAGSSAIAGGDDEMHIVFRTTKKKLKYYKGDPAADVDTWTVKENIDGLCCTSAPALYFTTGGSIRVAYGDGTKKAAGLKFALRSGGEWKKSKAAGGRVKHVDLVLDHAPGVFTPPSNHPRIAYVVKNKGTFIAWKPAPNAKGKWTRSLVGRNQGPTGLDFWSNRQKQFLSGKGNMAMVLSGGPIGIVLSISNNGKEKRGVFLGDWLTFARKGKGVFYTHQ